MENREELTEIGGPVGPRLSASELPQVIWGSAAPLWDDGHYRSAVQAAGGALEAKLQANAGPGVRAGSRYPFSLKDPTPESPRLRLRDIDTDPASKTRTSAHEGAAFLVRGAFMGVRNLVSHPGWPEPDHSEALERQNQEMIQEHIRKQVMVEVTWRSKLKRWSTVTMRTG